MIALGDHRFFRSWVFPVELGHRSESNHRFGGRVSSRKRMVPDIHVTNWENSTFVFLILIIILLDSKLI